MNPKPNYKGLEPINVTTTIHIDNQQLPQNLNILNNYIKESHKNKIISSTHLALFPSGTVPPELTPLSLVAAAFYISFQPF